jgi:hydroxymethylpyrimidine/phosphomethylpyrimidine kinase
MKVVLSIAGSDSSGGAGIQADLKTFEAFETFGTSAITVLTAQNTQGVTDIQPLQPEFVKAQIQAVLADFDVAAIKIGMLFNAEIISMLKEIIQDLAIPIVLDPVFISKAGSPLLQDEAVDKMKELFEYATVITPNQYEAKALFDYDVSNETEMRSHQFKSPVLVKNHHDLGKGVSVDKLFIGEHVIDFESPLINTKNLHGTGCSFSSAIAANLALGYNLQDSIRSAKSFISKALEHAPSIGYGPGPINHKRGILYA